jgi:hypothetical protein
MKKVLSSKKNVKERVFSALNWEGARLREISRRLGDTSKGSVSCALTHLKREGKAKHINGMWTRKRAAGAGKKAVTTTSETTTPIPAKKPVKVTPMSKEKLLSARQEKIDKESLESALSSLTEAREILTKILTLPISEGSKLYLAREAFGGLFGGAIGVRGKQ